MRLRYEVTVELLYEDVKLLFCYRVIADVALDGSGDAHGARRGGAARGTRGSAVNESDHQRWHSSDSEYALIRQLLFTHSVIQLFIHSLPHSLTRGLTGSLIHSRID